MEFGGNICSEPISLVWFATKSIPLENIQRRQNHLCTSIITSSSSKTKSGPKNFCYAIWVVRQFFYRNSPHYRGSCCGLHELFRTLIAIMNLRICSIYFWSCSGFFFNGVWIMSFSSVNVISMYVGGWSLFQGCVGEYAVGVLEQKSYSKRNIGPCSLCREQLLMLWSSCIQDIWGTSLIYFLPSHT